MILLERHGIRVQAQTPTEVAHFKRLGYVEVQADPLPEPEITPEPTPAPEIAPVEVEPEPVKVKEKGAKK